MPRAHSQHYSLAALLGAAVTIPAVVLFGRVPSDDHWASDLTDSAHGPAFAIITLVIIALLRRMPKRHAGVLCDYSIAIAIAVLLGGLIELLQLVTGRDASLDDLGRDTLGALAAAGFLAFVDVPIRELPSRRAIQLTGLLIGVISTAIAIAPLAVSVAAYTQRRLDFPTLVDFSSPVGTYFLYVYPTVTVNQEPLPRALAGGSRGDVGLHVHLAADKVSGLGLSEPRPDWRSYQTLALDLANPTDVLLLLHLNVHDRSQSLDRQAGYVGKIEIAPHSRTVHVIALRNLSAAKGRANVNLALIDFIELSRPPGDSAHEFYVVRIWLE